MRVDGLRQNMDTELSDQAIEWLVMLHSGRARDDDWAAFSLWRRTSQAHELAAQEAEAIWHGLGAAGEMTRKEDRKRVTRRTVLGGTAAVVAGIAMERAGLFGGAPFADYATGVAEQRDILLADGSSAYLNASTALSVDLDGQARRLVLHQGQATFKVARDPSRPFTVTAGPGSTRALGTVFDIDMRPREVVVTVLEGRVGVSAQARPSLEVATAANQRTRYAPDRPPAPVENVNAEQETAWRRGKLIFRARPLGDVVAEIERHRSGVIVIANEAIRSLVVTGVFDLNEPDVILDTIEETLPVRISRLPLVTIMR